VLSVQVVMYNGRSQEVKRNFTRFQDKAYSGCLRHDGKLMVAGGETGIVQVPYPTPAHHK
jgi:U3 small nucleolar RNA-associated protein 15